MENYLLYSLNSHAEGLTELLKRVEDGELTKEIVADTIEALQGEIGQKCDIIADTITCMNSDVKALDDEIKRLQDRRDMLKKGVQSLREGTQSVLESLDQQKIKTLRHTFTVSNVGGKQALELTGEVPAECSIVKLEPDKEKIRKALESGEELDFAQLKPRAKTLKIK